MSRSVVDGLGRTVARRGVRRHGLAGAATTRYDLADRLHIGDRPGRQPDDATPTTWPAGGPPGRTRTPARWTFGYDDAGDQTSATDAAGGVTHTSYDALGPADRAAQRRRHRPGPGPLGVRRARREGTARPQHPDHRRRATGSSDVTGYDGRGRPLGTQWTVPPGVPGLSGTYRVSRGYDPADNVVSVQLPAVGGLPAETVTTRLQQPGPARVDGRPRRVRLGGHLRRPGPTIVARPRDRARAGRPGWRRRGRTTRTSGWPGCRPSPAGPRWSTTSSATTSTGDLTSRTTQLGRALAGVLRLRRARPAHLRLHHHGRGVRRQPARHRRPALRPHLHVHRRTATCRPGWRTAPRTAYTYPTGAGVARPHAPTAVGADRYTWDANGNLTSRTVGRPDRDTRLGRRAAAGRGRRTGGHEQLRLRRRRRRGCCAPRRPGRTLYIAGHEITASPTGAAVTADAQLRLRRQAGRHRAPAPGSTTWSPTSRARSRPACRPAEQLEVARTYTPYGKRRGGGTLDTDRGWIGQVEDDSTSLSYLNARYYDPGIGRFISPDPLYSPAEPQSLNPYSYATNNPVGKSDPSGLYADGISPNGWKQRKATRVAARRVFNTAVKVAATVSRAAATAGASIGRALAAAATAATWLAAAVRAAREHHVRGLREMHKANGNPAFWRGLAKAGSARGLILRGLFAVNADPDFCEPCLPPAVRRNFVKKRTPSQGIEEGKRDGRMGTDRRTI